MPLEREGGAQSTVRDVMDSFRSKFGEDSSTWAYAQRLFWKRLCDLGADRATKRPAECLDIDVTAFLDEGEVAALEAEMDRLHK